MKKFKWGMLVAALCIAMCAMLGIAGCSQSSSQPQGTGSMAVKDEEPGLNPDVNYNKPFFCMIMGGDTRVGTADEDKVKEKESRSDVMILAYVDPKRKYISLMSIPRDCDVTYKGKQMKINTIMFKDGPEATCKFLEKKLKISIPYYFEMSFVQWANFVDNMDGVKQDVPVSLKWRDIIKGDMVNIKAGKGQTLNGTEALVFARDRHQYAGPGEAVRQIHNRNMVKTLINKVAASENPTSYVDILLGGCNSNMNRVELTTYMTNFLAKDKKIKWNLGTAPWEGTFITSDYWAIDTNWDTIKTEVAAMKENNSLTAIVPLCDVEAGSN